MNNQTKTEITSQAGCKTRLRIQALGLLAAILGITACTSIDADASDNSNWIEVDSNSAMYQPQEDRFREEYFEISLLAQRALEFKLVMNEQDTVVYNWTADTDSPELLWVEFHGHTEREQDKPGTLVFYLKHKGRQEEGSLTAPFDGIHGWYLENNSDEDMLIRFQVAGWFNEAFEVPVPR